MYLVHSRHLTSYEQPLVPLALDDGFLVIHGVHSAARIRRYIVPDRGFALFDRVRCMTDVDGTTMVRWYLEELCETTKDCKVHIQEAP